MSLEFNKTLVQKYQLELFSKWKMDLIEEIIHENYKISPKSVSIVTSNNPEGRENFRNRLIAIKMGMPDMSYEIITMVAEGNRVISYWTVKGTQKDVLFGFPSKGKFAKVFGTILFVFKDRKIISADVNFDSYSFLVQLGHVKIDKETSQDVLDYLKNVELMASQSYDPQSY